MKNYDGWTIKSFYGETPFLCSGYFGGYRTDVIKNFEKIWHKGAWRKERRKGNFKIVKVKLMEVEPRENKEKKDELNHDIQKTIY